MLRHGVHVGLSRWWRGCEYRSATLLEAWCLRRQRPDSDDLKRQALCLLGIRFWPFPPPLRETGYALCGRYSTQKNMYSQGIVALAQKPSRIDAGKCLTLHATISKFHVAQKELIVGTRALSTTLVNCSPNLSTYIQIYPHMKEVVQFSCRFYGQ